MSRLKQYLKEEYLMRFKKGGEVFVNPSFKEMREVAGESGIRFTADSRNKKVYVWNEFDHIHEKAWKEIAPSDNAGKLSQQGILLEGEAWQKGNKFQMFWSDQMESFFGWDVDDMKMMKKKFKWVNKYIDIDTAFNEWIKKYK